MKANDFFELTASAVRRLATGKIDGSSEPSSSLVACRALRAPAYVNIDYGSKASAFDRIQVDAPVAHRHGRSKNGLNWFV